MDPQELARRLRAARAYAGLRSVEALADAIDEKGLGVKTLRSIEQGTRPVYKRELAAIADACGLPVEFFTEDNPFAEPVPDDDLLAAEIRTNRDAIMESVRQGRQERQAIIQLLQTQQELLEAQTRILQRMEAVAAGLPGDDTLKALTEAAQQLEQASPTGAANTDVPSTGAAGTGLRQAEP